MKKSTLNLIMGVCLILAVIFVFGVVVNLFDGSSLRAPTISIVDSSDNTISITEVRGAEGYEVYADGKLIGKTTKTEFCFDDLYKEFAESETASGRIEVTVKAYGSSLGRKAYSDESNSVKCNVIAG